MIEQFKNIMLAGLGAAFYTQEKIEKTIEHLIKSEHLSKEQGKKFLDELTEKGKSGQEELKKRINDEISAMLDKYQPVKKEEFDALCARVEKLEQNAGDGQGTPSGAPAEDQP